MNTKHYVTYEVAKMLKEKGYNEETDYVIDDEVKELMRGWRTNEVIPDVFADYFFSCPTLLEAMDWLEKRGIRISIKYDWIECAWYYVVIDGTPTIKNITEVEKSDGIFYKDRNECMNEAIKKGLELL